jgi:hypothetical protein
MYICEDLHTSYRTNYINTDLTTLEILEIYNKTKKFICNTIPVEQVDYLNNNINDLIIFERNKNALRCYSCNQNNNFNL